MKSIKHLGTIIAGAGAGIVNGLLGAGGGMVLVPLLGKLTDLKDKEVFASSVAIILPISILTLLLSCQWDTIPWRQTVPYLLGSAAGGILAGKFSKNIPTLWLHRGLGALILWGGIRYLC